MGWPHLRGRVGAEFNEIGHTHRFVHAKGQRRLAASRSMTRWPPSPCAEAPARRLRIVDVVEDARTLRPRRPAPDCSPARARPYGRARRVPTRARNACREPHRPDRRGRTPTPPAAGGLRERARRCVRAPSRAWAPADGGRRVRRVASCRPPPSASICAGAAVAPNAPARNALRLQEAAQPAERPRQGGRPSAASARASCTRPAPSISIPRSMVRERKAAIEIERTLQRGFGARRIVRHLTQDRIVVLRGVADVDRARSGHGREALRLLVRPASARSRTCSISLASGRLASGPSPAGGAMDSGNGGMIGGK